MAKIKAKVYCRHCGGQCDERFNDTGKDEWDSHYPVELCIESLRDRLASVTRLALKMSEVFEDEDSDGKSD